MPKVALRSAFPLPSDPGQIVDIPTYHPSTEQFMDPISYIASIQSDAEPYGMCRIVPPDEWKVCKTRTCVERYLLWKDTGIVKFIAPFCQDKNTRIFSNAFRFNYLSQSDKSIGFLIGH